MKPLPLKQFFYDPVEDVYVAYAPFTYAFWPSWRMYRLVWNGADGSLNEVYDRPGGDIFLSLDKPYQRRRL